jgi:hypothetical protein
MNITQIHKDRQTDTLTNTQTHTHSETGTLSIFKACGMLYAIAEILALTY